MKIISQFLDLQNEGFGFQSKLPFNSRDCVMRVIANCNSLLEAGE